MTGVREFLRGVQSIVDERPKYKLGMDGTGGLCDCIGLVIGGIRRAGGTWTGTHGSNWAARHAIANLRPTDSPALGEVVFKSREPGSAGYDLPGAYLADSDLRDYYHVGVVTSVAPLEITHCTSGANGGGIKVDNLETVPGAWTHAGWLKEVEYMAENENAGGGGAPVTATVKTGNGGPLNMRMAPSILSALVTRIPNGATVEIVEQEGEWTRVAWEGRAGYVMSSFLETGSPVTATARELAMQVYDLIKNYLGE